MFKFTVFRFLENTFVSQKIKKGQSQKKTATLMKDSFLLADSKL